MKTACVVLLLAEAVLFIAEIITAIIGKLHMGVLGYPDEWESKKCEAVYTVLAVASMAGIVVFMVLTAILVIRR